VKKLLELNLNYKYVIKPLKRPTVNWRTRSISNGSKEDEEAVSYDTNLQISKEVRQEIKNIFASKKDIAVTVELVNFYATKDKKKHGLPKLTVPDASNVLKLWEDAVSNGQLYPDDNIVFSSQASKYWAETSSAKVKVCYYEI